jgi:hypothetical protein
LRYVESIRMHISAIFDILDSAVQVIKYRLDLLLHFDKKLGLLLLLE